MARSTLTRRTPPPRSTIEKDAPLLDLGHEVVAKGTLVRAITVGGDYIGGTLLSVDHRDGVPFTAAIHTTGTYSQVRHVYVDKVEVIGS